MIKDEGKCFLLNELSLKAVRSGDLDLAKRYRIEFHVLRERAWADLPGGRRVSP